MENQQIPGAEILLQAGFYPEAQADQILNQLSDEIDWEQRMVTVHGRTYPQPRLVAWHGTGAYTYSGLRLEPKPMTLLLAAMQQDVEQALGCRFNSVLLNRYVAGRNHGIGFHADNEPELGRNPRIAMLTFGEGRALEFKPKKWLADKEPAAVPTSVPTEHGSLLVMQGRTQAGWLHGITKKIGKADRITLTFRSIEG